MCGSAFCHNRLNLNLLENIEHNAKQISWDDKNIEDLTLVVISYEIYETSLRRINFIWNYHECKILFTMCLF